MLHLIIPVGPLQCNCSILGDEATHQAMIVDPGDNIDQLLRLLAEHKLKLQLIAITHGHIDHIAGAARLKAATGAPVYMNSGDQPQLKLLDMQAAWVGMQSPGEVKIDHDVKDGDTLRFGTIAAQAIHTPGHTEGSTSLYLAGEKKLIAGDTLFAGSIGRTDLPGGDFEKIMASLHGKLMALPDEVVVVPGHGPVSTIGEERETNPFLTDKRYKPKVQAE